LEADCLVIGADAVADVNKYAKHLFSSSYMESSRLSSETGADLFADPFRPVVK